MSHFLIKREMPGASDIPKNKLNEIGKGSESVLEEMRNEGKDIKQIESFVTAGAIFCVYDATSEDLVHEHSKRSGIGVTEVSEIASVVRHNTSLVS